MTVEHDRLNLGEERVLAVDMPPTDLNHTNFRIGKIVDCAGQAFPCRNKICVKNCNKLTGCVLQTLCQGSRLKALPVCAMQTMDVQSYRLIAFHQCPGNVLSLI